MNTRVETPALNVRLRKSVDRDQSGKAERYSFGNQNFDLAPFLTENSSVSFTRTINAPAGSFQIVVGDRGVVHDNVLDSLYGIAEPMDFVEIRMAQRPHEHKDKLPLVFRGVITTVRRDESMSQDGKPQRTVTISGQDFGKFFQIIQDRYLQGNPLGQNWLTSQVMQNHYGIPFMILPSGEFMTQVIQNVANKFLADFSSPAIKPFTIDVSGSDPADMVLPQGYQSMPMGTLWDFIKKYGDLGPLNELILDDTENGPHLIYRKPPFHTIDGAPIYGSVADFVVVSPRHVTRISVTRSDADVANWVWIRHPRIALYTDVDLRLSSYGTNQANVFLDNPNATKSLYGIRTLEIDSQHSSAVEQNAPEAVKNVQLNNFKDYFVRKTSQLKLANQDNAVFESGTMVIQGNEKVKPGTTVQIARGDAIVNYYIQSVTQTFNPFKSFITTAQFVRGRGFVERSTPDGSGSATPYLEEIGRGPYEGTKT